MKNFDLPNRIEGRFSIDFINGEFVCDSAYKLGDDNGMTTNEYIMSRQREWFDTPKGYWERNVTDRAKLAYLLLK